MVLPVCQPKINRRSISYINRQLTCHLALVNLFHCKIVDEAKNPKDLKFNWKVIAYDNDFDLIDRLQTLYQTGMKEFLGEDVANVSKKEIVSAFTYVKDDPDATKGAVLKFFKEMLQELVI